MALTVDIGNSSSARRETEPKVASIIAEEGDICTGWKAARAGRNPDVTEEIGGVSEKVEGVSPECAARYCQVNAIFFKYSTFVILINLC